MNDFDQAARFLLKADPAGHIRWLFPELDASLQFRKWLDSQSAPRPGEPDRRCDTIAELYDTTGASEPRALVVELFTAADPDATPRTLEYVGRFAREMRHGPHDRDRYNFSAAMIFLTSAPVVLSLVSNLPGARRTLAFEPEPLIVSNKVAVASLQAFAQNQVGWGILAWCSLMQGGQDAEFVALWRGVVEKLSDLGVQRILVDTACVLAQLTESADLWKEGVKGMLVTESTLMREQRDLGALRAWREAVLKLLGTRFPVPADLRDRIEAETDAADLQRWHLLVNTVSDLDAFRSAIGPG